MTKKILLIGEGGQGVQTIAKVISEAAAASHSNISYIPSFGVEQRGTPSVAYITISNEEIFYPRFEKADLIVVLSHRGIQLIKSFIASDTLIIFDSTIIDSTPLKSSSKYVYGIPATQKANELGFGKAFNIVIAGFLAKTIKIDRVKTWKIIEEILGKKFKDDKIRDFNHKAFLSGHQMEAEIDKFSRPDFAPEKREIIKKGFGKTCHILPSKCKGCGLCIAKCPVKALKQSETLGVFGTPVPEIDLEKCVACGNCNLFCPDSAILVKKSKSFNRLTG